MNASAESHLCMLKTQDNCSVFAIVRRGAPVDDFEAQIIQVL